MMWKTQYYVVSLIPLRMLPHTWQRRPFSQARVGPPMYSTGTKYLVPVTGYSAVSFKCVEK